MINNFFLGIKRRIYRHRKLLARYSDPDTIFIYQMGKVGSTTLEESIEGAVHIHAFYSKNHSCPARLMGLSKFGFLHILLRAEQKVLNYLLRRAFRSRRATKIVTLVRDVQKRNISMFFHDLDAYLYAAHTNCLSTRRKPIPTRVQDKKLLVNVFETEFDHDYPLQWFDKEFLPMTGINVYDYEFDKEKGIGFSTKGSVEVLCLNTDYINDNLTSISCFVGKKVTLSNTNSATEKWYGAIYNDFKKSYSAPKVIQDKIRNSRFNKHFFES